MIYYSVYEDCIERALLRNLTTAALQYEVGILESVAAAVGAMPLSK